MNPYIQDILAQPAALQVALKNYTASMLEKIDLADFDRVIISGMGSSYYAAYPALVCPYPTRQCGGVVALLARDDRAPLPALDELTIWAQRRTGEFAGTHPRAASCTVIGIRQ